MQQLRQNFGRLINRTKHIYLPTHCFHLQHNALPQLCLAKWQHTTMEEQDDFSNHTAAFEAWLASRRVTISPSVQLSDLRVQNAGRGMGTVTERSRCRQQF